MPTISRLHHVACVLLCIWGMEDVNMEKIKCTHCGRLFSNMVAYVTHCFERDPYTLKHTCPPERD